MTAKSSVIYANKPGSNFDLDYYLKTHMPLVKEQWGPQGLKSWEVIQYKDGLSGAQPSFTIEAILTWDNYESIGKASTSEAAKTVFGDVPKFTDIQPVFTAGNVVGSG